MSRAWIGSVGVTAVCALVFACIAGLTPAAAMRQRAAKEIPVSDAASFERAVSSARAGDTIHLADGSYPALSVTGRKYASPVRIAGTRNARLAGLKVGGSSNLVVSGITVTPPASDRVVVQIAASSNITLDGVLIDGRTETAGAWIQTDPSDSKVTISNSEITDCGTGNRCIAPGANGLQILHDAFHDCLDCDFIRGQAGGPTLIADNTFDRAIPGACGTKCNHNDMVQVLGGGPWTIVRNRFGEQRVGAAPVFVSTSVNNRTNRIHDVTIASNLFVSGSSGYFAMQIAVGGSPGPPLDVSVVNNTILSGSASAIRLGSPWAGLPEDQKPLVANNIFGKSVKNDLCAEARTSHNLVEQGTACPGDFVGSANLDAIGAPTKASALVLGRADSAYAPATDYYGHPTGTAPDIGAIQFGDFRPPFELSAPAGLTVRRSWLRKHGWRFTVRVKLSGVTTLRSRMLLRYKPLLTRTATVSGKTARTESFVIPAAARSASRLRLEFRGTAQDGRKVVRTTILRLPA